MRRIFVSLSALLAVAACAVHDTPPGAGASSPASSAARSADAHGQFDATMQPQPAMRVAAAQRLHPGLASMPDRGELLAYSAQHQRLREGAFTSYPVQLSEAHALRAARPGGAISLRTPDGRLIQLSYERHVEHADGNWTWVGRQGDGSDAVITFGEKAVFGSIEQRNGEPLQLTMIGATSWLVETDRRLLARGDDGRPPADDFLLPPALLPPRADVAAAGSTRVAPAPSTNNAVTAGRTVDVVIGYTTGLASQLGGASQAATRMNNLVEVTNQAYANSGVDARVRLVATVQVNFADATDNNDALEKLTGYDSTTNRSVTPDPAFNALRAARDQYGADLVSLVRAFRTPENAGCGVAWLVGGDRSAIDSRSAPFGFSVVSDGRDTDGAQTFFCRDETLAHELGHNMGQAHNSEDSTGDNGALSYGAHTYSFGWRESSPGCFYTVMSYRTADSCQQAIRYFANPSVLYGGRPTGVANSADNARSLNQTVPLIATFRAPVVVEPPAMTVSPLPPPTSRDMDGDGRADMTWYQPTFQSVASWYLQGNQIVRHGMQATGKGYRVLATGDFNGDRRLDMIWAGSGGDLQMWLSTGSSFIYQPFVDATGLAGQPYVFYPTGWTLAAAGDMSGDGKTDLVWYNPAARRVAYWTMDGNAIVRHGGQATGGGYRVLANGDYDRDGRVDLLWLGDGGDLQMWFSDGAGFVYRPFVDATRPAGQQAVAYPVGWSLVASADVDSDGDSDLVWHTPGGQRVAQWAIEGGAIVSHAEQVTGYGYQVITSGDFDGDRRIDLVWKGLDGDLQFWFSNGSQFAWRPFLDSTGLAGQPYVSFPQGWSIASTAP